MKELKEIRKICEEVFKEEIVYSRKSEIVDVKSAYAYLAYNYSSSGLTGIGKEIGLDHSTIIHLVKNVFPVRCEDYRFVNKYERCERLIKENSTIQNIKIDRLKNNKLIAEHIIEYWTKQINKNEKELLKLENKS